MAHMLEVTEPDAMESGAIVLVFLGLLGACVGSFLNVVVYRLPRGLSVQTPSRSFCPSCGATIPWWLNLPIISWLWLRGKSACCHKPIAARYWLVEVACTALFLLIGWVFAYERFDTQLWLCLWAAALLALLAMDWELMVVHPTVAVLAAGAGYCAAVNDPTLCDPSAVTYLEGVLWGLVGAAGGYLFFRLVALGGRLLFGRRRLTFAGDEPWLLRQQGEDIVLSVADKNYAWSEVFPESSAMIQLHDAVVEGEPAPRGTASLTEDALLLPGGVRRELETYDHLSGTCRGLTLHREAMGSGDAWIAMAIGALCGWQGVVFALVGGSFIGLFMAALMRIRRGVPMPFGPAIILAAYVWLFWGPQLLALYTQYFKYE